MARNSPNLPADWLKLARSDLKSGQLTMALRRKLCTAGILAPLVLALALLSCGGSSAFKRGLEYEQLKNYDAALQSYEEALSADPDNAKYRLYFERARFQAAMAHFDRGRRFRGEGRLEEALQEFRRAVQIDPSIAAAHQEVETVAALIRDRERQAEQGEPEGPKEDLYPSRQFLPVFKLSGEVRKAYATLGKVGGINVIFAPDFNPTPPEVELDFIDVTLTEALDLLALQSKTYWSVLKENTILVAEDTQQTRQRYQEEIVRTFHLSNVGDKTDLGQIATALRSLLLMNKVAQIDSQNAIVVRDTPDKIAAAERIIRSIDKSKPEVMIEVYILEVVGTVRQFLGLRPGLPSAINVSPNGPQDEGGSNAIRLSELGQLGRDSFSATIPSIQLGQLYTRVKGRVLQNPTLRASDGEEATFKVGTQQPIASGSFSTGIGGGTGFGGGAFTTFTTVDVGVTLTITPQVLLNRDISLDIDVALKTISGFETLDGNRYPILANREINHDIRLREGESSVVGGIIQRSDSVTVDGIPGLSKIPLLRYLFSTEDNNISDNEIIVVITPRIVRLPDILEQDTSLALLGSSNTPKFLGSPKELIGEVPAPHTENGQTAPPRAGSGSTVTDGPGATLQEPPPSTDRPAPRLAFVRLVGPSEPASRGSRFRVGVAVANAQQVHGLSLNFRFNPERVQLVDVQGGGFLSSDGISVALAERLENSLGRAVISMTRPPDSPGVTGSGVLMNLRFEAVGTGDGAISFGPNSVLRDSGQAVIPTSLAGTEVTIQ